jgi:hypothetical protein
MWKNKFEGNQSIGMQIALLLATCFAIFCFYYQIKQPPCCDADGYTRIAKAYVESGISLNEKELDNLRLYGYPLFLSWIIKLAGILGLQFKFLLFISQLTLYFLGVYLLSQVIVKNYSRQIGIIVFYSLLANLVIYPYLAIALTDGFTAILLVYIVYAILKIFTYTSPGTDANKTVGWRILLGYLIGFAVMVRPGSIYLLFPLCVVVCIFIYCQKKNLFALGVLSVSSILIGFLLAVTPQVIYNFSAFNVLSFMPVADLGASQFDWGSHVLKYMTNLSGGNMQMCYTSPWTQGSHGEGLAWYMHNPLVGFMTIFSHLYGVLDFDYLFPYVYKLHIKYRPVLFIFSQFVVFWGLAGYFYGVRELHKYDAALKTARSNAVRILFTYAFPCLLIGWASVHAFSGSENRWSLPIIAALLPLSVWVVFVKLPLIRQNAKIYGVFFLYLVFAVWMSSFLSSLMQYCS